CVVLRSVKHAVNNSRVARGLVHGPNSLNATFIRQGRISVRLRKLARNLRNGHLAQKWQIGDWMGPPTLRYQGIGWGCPLFGDWMGPPTLRCQGNVHGAFRLLGK